MISQIGGLSLFSAPFFDLAVGLQVIVAAFALLGRRRMTLIAMAASVLYWILYRVVSATGFPGFRTRCSCWPPVVTSWGQPPCWRRQDRRAGATW